MLRQDDGVSVDENGTEIPRECRRSDAGVGDGLSSGNTGSRRLRCRLVDDVTEVVDVVLDEVGEVRQFVEAVACAASDGDFEGVVEETDLVASKGAYRHIESSSNSDNARKVWILDEVDVLQVDVVAVVLKFFWLRFLNNSKILATCESSNKNS